MEIEIFLFLMQYGLAEDTLRQGSPNLKEVSPDELYSQSAIYIAAAHALKPNYSVRDQCIFLDYRGLPYIQAIYVAQLLANEILSHEFNKES